MTTPKVSIALKASWKMKYSSLSLRELWVTLMKSSSESISGFPHRMTMVSLEDRTDEKNARWTALLELVGQREQEARSWHVKKEEEEEARAVDRYVESVREESTEDLQRRAGGVRIHYVIRRCDNVRFGTPATRAEIEALEKALKNRRARDRERRYQGDRSTR
jgi:hypothetical protein